MNNTRNENHTLDPMLRADEAAALLGGSRATFWRRVQDGTIPRPIKIGGMSRWPQSEILAVIENAKAQRDNPSEAA